jgi:hypothetical protein
LIATLIAGCGTINYRAGESFDPLRLKHDLQSGVSDSAQVTSVLGKPNGTGRAMMPYHDAPRTVWTYYYADGGVDTGSGKIHEDRRYLFVFLNDGVFEGYMWFNSKLH